MATAAKAGKGSVLKKGTASSPLSFNTILEALEIKLSGADTEEIDVSNMDSGAFKEFIAGFTDPGSLTFRANFRADSATHTALFADQAAGTVWDWQLVLSNTQGTFSFSGFVKTITVDPQLKGQQILEMTIRITGTISYA